MNIRNFLHSQSSTYPSPSRRYFPMSGQRTGDGEESVITNSKDASSYPDTGPRMTISLHHWQQNFRRRYFPTPGQRTGDGEISARIRRIRQYRYFPIPRHRSWDREVSAPFVERYFPTGPRIMISLHHWQQPFLRRHFPMPGQKTGDGEISA